MRPFNTIQFFIGFVLVCCVIHLYSTTSSRGGGGVGGDAVFIKHELHYCFKYL